MKAKKASKLNLDGRVALQDVIPLETPYLIYLDPSSVCNFHCKFCPTGHKNLIDDSNYSRSVMDLNLFKKVIDSLNEFSQPIKVLRLNKIGEPLINKDIAKMISYAKKSGCVEYIDFATNGSLFNQNLITELIDAGLDRLNISIEGISSKQYKDTCKVDIDFDQLVEKIKWLYGNKGNCEITIKIPKNYLSADDEKLFYSTFENHCDKIFVENLSPIWPEFDMDEYAGVKDSNTSQYGQTLQDKLVCTYIFYSMAINADGTVSACCPDWAEKLIIGNVNNQSVKDIWNSKELLDLQKQHLDGRRCDNETCKSCGHIKYSQVDNIDEYRTLLHNRLLS